MEYSKERSQESSMEYLNHAKHTVKKNLKYCMYMEIN